MTHVPEACVSQTLTMKLSFSFVLALALPLPLLAQGDSSSASVGGNQSGAGSNLSTDSDPGSDLRNGDLAEPAIQRVDKASLRTQLTAKNLIGRDVHDRSGRKIGSVHDVVLPPGSPSLATAFARESGLESKRSQKDRAIGSGTDSESVGGMSGRNDDGRTLRDQSSTEAAAVSSDHLGDMEASAQRSGLNGRAEAANEPAVIIIAGGFAGLGGTTLRASMSQLRYDANERRLVLAVDEAQLSTLKDPGNRYPHTAN
jgi:hypothetical protein